MANQPYPNRTSCSCPTTGTAISMTAMGGTARVIPLISAPVPRCRVHQAEARPRAAQELAGPSANRSPGTSHMARTAATDIGRTGPNSAVTATRGRQAA